MCFSGDKRDEDEYIVPVRLVNNQPTIIKTAPTFRPSSGHGHAGNAIILASRSPRTSQRSSTYRLERQSTSRSPRNSNQQIVRVESTRISPSRPSSGQLQISTSPRTSTGRIQIVEREPSRLAAVLLNPSPNRVAPHHRRSTSQVIVINRSPSQRQVPIAPRISDSLLVNTSGATYTIGHTTRPNLPLLQREPRVIDIEPRTSRLSQISTGHVEIETAIGPRSRRHSNVQAICTTGNPRNSGSWRPVRERYVVTDSRGNKTEYYR